MIWNTRSQLNTSSRTKRPQEIIRLLLANRGFNSPSAIHTFLNPSLPEKLTLKQVGLSLSPINQAIRRLKQAHSHQESIVIYGDYDADGITATAILWETLHTLGFNVTPFIPHREKHGYGLSKQGVQDLLQTQKPKLIITVDNGIVVHQTAAFIRRQGIDLIITDHHQPSSQLPNALSIIHSTDISGAGVAWFFANRVISAFNSALQNKVLPTSTLDLLVIGTVADMMPAIGVNRSIIKHGLQALSQSSRPGIVALKHIAGLSPDVYLDTYHVGFVLGPRINAMGRLEHGLDALRLLCTHNASTAQKLARLLDDTNKTRQDLTQEMLALADQIYTSHFTGQNIIVIDHPDFHEGIIGLIAGKLTEKYSKPSIVISRGDEVSKASARSPSGINIIELIRTHQDLLIAAGGHPGAAGLSLATTNIRTFRRQINLTAQAIDPQLLQPSLNIDCAIELSDATLDLYNQIQSFAPFGLGNPTPVFSASARIVDIRTIGRDHNHLKLKVTSPGLDKPLDALFWQKAKDYNHLNLGDSIQLAFTLDQNTWNGNTQTQLILKDIHD